MFTNHHSVSLILYTFIITCVVLNVKAGNIDHIPVDSAIEDVDIIIKSESLTGKAILGRIFFRQISDQEYNSLPMAKAGGIFEGRIPGKYVKGPGIEYYIILYMDDGETATSPETDPALLPYFVAVLSPEQGWFEVLYPERNSVIDDRMPQISVAFSTDVIISGDKFQVSLDGEDISDKCEITGDFLLYLPSEELPSGVHTVVLTKLNKPEMMGSWQFGIMESQAIWQNFSGGMSLAWQYTKADSDSPFLTYSPGSNFGISAQIAGQILNRSLDMWINRSAFYISRSTDFGFGFYGNKTRINAGDIFPVTSKLTLDGMPVRGAEVNIEPFSKFSLYLVGAESRLFDDTEDQFIAGLLNSRFGLIRANLRPFGKRLELSSLYIHARNFTKSQPDIGFSIEKYNDIFSLMTKLNMFANLTLNGEFAVSDHLIRYDEGFVSETHKDNGVSVSLEKRIGTMDLEVFYLNIGEDFMSEVNPFIESGRNGFGISSRYSYKRFFSLRGEYGRYKRLDDINSEMRLNLSLSLARIPSFSAVYYQQRVPYANYDIKSGSLGLSYSLWKARFSASASTATTNLWTYNTEQNSKYLSSNVSFDATANTDIETEYSRFITQLSGDSRRAQWQAGAGIIRRIYKDHQISLELKAAELTEGEMAENNYFQWIFMLKYGYSL